MNSIWIAIIAFGAYIIAYNTYGKFIAAKLFRINQNNLMPSKELQDGVDYVPTRKEVLFGHHFASIAGTGPIVGPAIAIIWGWVPALLWVILGSIFMGAVHDFSALVISVRNKGVSIGEVASKLISPRVRTLLLLVIFFSLWIVVAIFAMVIGIIFNLYPQSVFPVWMQIPIAVWLGRMVYKRKGNLIATSLIAVALMYITIIIGIYFPISLTPIFGANTLAAWVVILLIYAFIASILPVWSLLQPRDFMNAYQLIIAMACLMLGVIVARPLVVAPAVNISPVGAPPILPFIFVSIACGAISGFHSLVSSGTTSKQLSSEADARFIGFGGMLTEGALAVLVIIAVSAGIGMGVSNKAGQFFTGAAAWNLRYSSWQAASGLAAKVAAFIDGAANMLKSIGIPFKLGLGIMGVFVASFAGTTLDTATRIQRYVLSEFGVDFNIRALRNRYSTTAIVVLFAFILCFLQASGQGALILWPLFGISNQLLAGLALLVTTVYLVKNGVNPTLTAIPMVFMIAITGWAMLVNLGEFMQAGKLHLVILGGVIFLLEIWMIIEAIAVAAKGKMRR